MIDRAFDLAWRAHYGQFRKSGEPYIIHGMETAKIVRRWGLGAEEVAAALCHDVIEDGWLNGRKINKEYVAGLLGERVAHLVDGITELGKEPDYVGKKPSKEYIMRKLLDAASLDLAVLIIKFADRLHNMRTLAYTKNESARKKAAETLYVYSRIADILGMWTLKRNFEDLAFKYLEPKIHQTIKEHRDMIIKESEAKINGILADLEEKLAPVQGRIKREVRGIFELYQRFGLRGKKLTDIAADDIWRVCVIVPDEPLLAGLSNCYLAEGMVHQHYRPAQNQKIEDHVYEACPNGHRFLHTYVQVPGGQLLIQVRERTMYREYRGGVLASVRKDRDWHSLNRRWLEALRKHLGREFSLNEADLYKIIAAESAPITVYTPNRGRPFEFPKGATAVDFAWQFRPEGALRAVSAEINGHKERPLSDSLKDGDRVYIETSPEARPNLNWLEFVRTPAAKAGIKSYFQALNDREKMGLALEYLHEKLKSYFLPVKAFVSSSYFGVFLARNGYHSWREYLRRVGSGEIETSGLVLADFVAEYQTLIRDHSSKLDPIGFKLIGRDEPGLIGKITGKLFSLGMNISCSFSRTEIINGQEMGVVTLVVKGVGGDAGKVQTMQIAAILRFTDGITSFVQLGELEIEELETALRNV